MRILFLMRDDGFMTEPMNIMELSAIAKLNRPHRSTHLAVIERDDVVAIAKEIRPQIVACSAITGSHKQYLDALASIKEAVPQSFVILGGPYCSTFPEAITQNPFLDAIGIMECDDAWPAFLDAFEGGGVVDQVPNILTQQNASARLVTDPHTGQVFARPDSYNDRFSSLDSLPHLDRALVYDNTAFLHRPKRTHMAGRGCPFRCQYCFEQDWNQMFQGKGKMLQRYSVDRLLDELESVGEQYDTRFWKFYDDVFPTFPSDMSWLTEFAEKYPRRIGLPFHCLTRCDLVVKKPEVLDLLKEAGTASITMSVESGNAFIRDHIITRDMDDSEMREAFALCQEKGIRTFANVILGIPGPRLPDIHDPDFHDKVSEIEADTRFFTPSRDSRRWQLDQQWDQIKALEAGITEGTYSMEQGRGKIRDSLSSLGLMESQVKYDRESAWYTVKLNTSMAEFPILYPYPRTGIGTYAARKGWFDGDFDKLHHSYQNRSPLSCFSEHEKAIQQNLALLAPLAILFSGSHHRWVRSITKPAVWLLLEFFSKITWSWASRFYERAYSLVKTHIYQERIYPMPRSLSEKIRDFPAAQRLDVFKQFEKRSIYGTGKGKPGALLRGDRPGQTLGGPPSV